VFTINTMLCIQGEDEVNHILKNRMEETGSALLKTARVEVNVIVAKSEHNDGNIGLSYPRTSYVVCWAKRRQDDAN
jgi:hypothetical protein